LENREKYEAQLNDFDPQRRREALDKLLDLVARRLIALPEPVSAVNLHSHTFYSYNGYGYSPTAFAWKARLAGLAVAGVVDFDVLDAVDEFLEAARRLGLKACAGIETRIFIPEYADREINSPGEPGISYHMGAGFTKSQASNPEFLAEMKAAAQARNRAILARVNPYLAPAELDYDRDVLPLTPNGNATERHLCMAYDARAKEVFTNDDDRVRFWSEKLGEGEAKIRTALADPAAIQGLIRAKTMKSGGVGYIKPEGPDFPRLDRVNAFSLGEGAIPTYTWLDGTTGGESAIEELLDLEMANGTAAINIVPERNWNIADPETRKRKVANLHRVVEIAQERGLPVLMGTEMNAPGQRFVDDFAAPELQPVIPAFLEGAYILYAHTVLQSKAGLGYLSDWAQSYFPNAREKNAFFAALGKKLQPARAETLELTPDTAPPDIL
jgi:hypothetical protein